MEEKTLVNTWHKVNGKWVHIVQVLKEDRLYLYTDGTLVMEGDAKDYPGIHYGGIETWK